MNIALQSSSASGVAAHVTLHELGVGALQPAWTECWADALLFSGSVDEVENESHLPGESLRQPPDLFSATESFSFHVGMADLA